jgi:hypothetical protein
MGNAERTYAVAGKLQQRVNAWSQSAPQINRNVAPILALAHYPVQLHRQRHISSAEPNTEVPRKYPDIRKRSLLAQNYTASGWK